MTNEILEFYRYKKLYNGSSCEVHPQSGAAMEMTYFVSIICRLLCHFSIGSYADRMRWPRSDLLHLDSSLVTELGVLLMIRSSGVTRRGNVVHAVHG